MSDECRGETRLSKIDEGQLEDIENQTPINGRTYSVSCQSMAPRSILGMEYKGFFQTGGYGRSVLMHNEDADESLLSPSELEFMSDVNAINQGHDVEFPPLGPSQYQD